VDVTDEAKEFNKRGEFLTGTGIVYNYGIWKPTKGKFRLTAGTRSGPRPRDATRKPAGHSRQPLYEAHKALVRILPHIEDAVRDKDRISHRQRECLHPYCSSKTRHRARERAREGRLLYHVHVLSVPVDDRHMRLGTSLPSRETLGWTWMWLPLN